MYAIVRPLWVGKLIGQTHVPYNCGLRVRGSLHAVWTRRESASTTCFYHLLSLTQLQTVLLLIPYGEALAARGAARCCAKAARERVLVEL
jgi:hypothetical protein